MFRFCQGEVETPIILPTLKVQKLRESISYMHPENPTTNNRLREKNSL